MVCRGSQSSAVSAAEKEDIQEQESGTEMANINMISFGSNYYIILAKLKTSSKHTTRMVPCKGDIGCNGNIIPFIIFKKYFHCTTEDRLMATKDTTTLKTYKSTTITE